MNLPSSLPDCRYRSIRRFQVWLFCVPLALLFSCKVMYSPTMQPVPGFRAKGDGHVDVGFRSASLSYASGHNFGVSLNAHYQLFNVMETALNGPDASGRALEQRFVSGSAVFYSAKERGSFEFLPGFGLGQSQMNYQTAGKVDRSSPAIDTRFSVFFLQSNFIRTKARTDYIFSARLSVLDFYKEREWDGSGLALDGTGFFSPAFTIRWRKSHFGLFGQAQVSVALSRGEGVQYPYDTIRPFSHALNLYGGLQYHLKR